MKCTIVPPPEPIDFKPVTIQFTFECQEDLNAFGCLTNSAVLDKSLKDIGGSSLDFATLEQAGGRLSHTQLTKFHKALTQRLKEYGFSEK